MKRSHMLHYILGSYNGSYRGGMSEMSDFERMDYILKGLENLGMKYINSDAFDDKFVLREHEIGWEDEEK